ncbi:MAG TPA: hypothetical protein VGQ80_10150 [Acidimicrobiia bacterium]|nr:hypothetical protein [Acidimicrobiia bacterium]
MTTADSPRTSARLVLGAIVAVSAAALLLSGCGSGAARSAPSAAAPGATVSVGPDGWDRSAGAAPGGVFGGARGSGGAGRAGPPEPAATTAAAGAPTAPTGATPPGGPGPAAAVPQPAGNGGTTAPAVDPGQSLAALDRALADLDTQITDADHDVATPEGDLR